MNISERLADFVIGLRYEDIPQLVRETQKKAILDALGIVYGASGIGDGCQAAFLAACECAANGEPEAAVIGRRAYLPAAWAAFANAAMIHSLDFGDTQMHAVVHSNASTFPAALAAAAHRGGVSGKELITALVAGSEVACRVALGVREDLEARGFYMPPIYTSFGATAAAARILGLTREELVGAFSLNLCQTTCSAELMNCADSDLRSVREAFAAKNAFLSCILAAKKLRGFADPLQGKLGFYHAYAGQPGDEEAILAGLGSHFEAGDLYFKLWPSCAGTHPVIRLLAEAAKERPGVAEEAEEIHVTVSVRNRMLVEPENLRKRPKSAITAKFSIPYTGALALLHGTVSLKDFGPECLENPEILELASRFTYEVNPKWGKDEGMNTETEIRLKNGSWIRKSLFQKDTDGGEPSWEEICEKFYSAAGLAKFSRTTDQYRSLADTVRCLENMENIDDWCRSLA